MACMHIRSKIVCLRMYRRNCTHHIALCAASASYNCAMSRLFDVCIKTCVSGCLHKSFNSHGLIVHELLYILPQHVSQLLHVLQNARESGVEKIEKNETK